MAGQLRGTCLLHDFLRARTRVLRSFLRIWLWHDLTTLICGGIRLRFRAARIGLCIATRRVLLRIITRVTRVTRMSRITVFLARKEPGNSGVTSSVIPGTDALLPVLVLLQGEAGAASIHGASSAGGFLGDEFRLEHDKAIVEKGARESHDEDLCSKGPRAWFEQFGDAAFDVVRRDEGALREVCLVALCDVAMTCSESSSRPMAAS